MKQSLKSYSYVDHNYALAKYANLETDVEVQNLSLLIVEDNPDDLDIINHQLRAITSYNFNIKHVNNLEEARYELSTDKHDIALVDFWLGHETGARVFLESGGRSSKTALILLTGLRNNNIQDLALRAGALHCVNKDNMSPTILESTIRSSLYTHKVEKELTTTVQALNEAMDAKADFFSKLGHDLKTPLTCMMAYAEVIGTGLNKGKSSEKYSDYAERIGESGQHLLHLLNNLIQESLDGKEITGNVFEKSDIQSIIDRSVRMVGILLKKREHTLKVHPLEGPLLIECDQYAISQALVNLLTNAIKYTEPGGKIEIYTEIKDLTVKIHISDNGPGMSRANIAEALRPYGRVNHIGQETQEGTGLGLPIVTQIMNRHEGSFSLESEKRKGTKAILSLPISKHYN